MRQSLVYFGLFLFFAVAIGGVKYLDIYSLKYLNCAEKWDESIELAQTQPALAERLLVLEAEAKMTFEGETCPALRNNHSQEVRTKLQAVIS